MFNFIIIFNTVEECEIVSIKLENFNNRSFHLSILSNDSILESLYFVKTDGLLADSETPVHLMNLQSLKKMLGVVVNEDYRFIKTTIREVLIIINNNYNYHNS